MAFRLVPLLAACYVVSYLDRVNVSFAKLQMLGELGLSEASYGLGAGIFFWGYVLFEVPSNFMLHRHGARLWICRIMVTWGVVSMSFAFIGPLASATGLSRETVFYVLRFLLGISEAGFFPGVVLYLTYWFPPWRQSQVMAWFLLALPLSLVIGAPLSGWIMASLSQPGFQGWQFLFVIEGVPAVVLGLVVLLFLDDRPDDARWLDDEEKRLLKANFPVAPHASRDFGAAVRDYRVWLLAMILLTFGTGFYGISFWLPTIIRESGISDPLAIGLLASVPFVAAMVAMVGVSWHSGRTGELRWHAAIPAFVGATGLLLSAVFAGRLAVSMACITVGAAGMLALTPVYWALPGRFLTGTAAAGGIALINSFGSLAGFSGSTITAYAQSLTGSASTGTYVLAAMLAASGGLILCIPKAVLRNP